MFRALILGAVAIGLIAVSFNATAVEVPEVSGPPLYPFKMGEDRKSRRLRDGQEMIQVTTLIDENTGKSGRGDGCSWTFSREDAYGPSLSWTNCSPGAWGTGSASDIQREGQLWPFKVGNKVRYRFTSQNKKGKTNRKAFRNCEVSGTETITAGGKEYATYRIDCEEHSGTRTFNYAPSAQMTVYAERNHKKRGKTTMEFLEEL